ncbi:MAG: ABC transporter permease [Candidatus Helarchaeota archaeon]
MSNTWVIFRTSLKMAFRSITSRKFRAFLTILGITIGITLFITLMSIGIGMQTSISALLAKFVGAEVVVSSKISGSRPSVPPEVVNLLGKVDHVEKSFGLIQDYLTIQGQFVMVIATDPSEIEFLTGIKLVRGMSLEEAVEQNISQPAYIDNTLATQLHLDIGDKLIATSQSSGVFLQLNIVGVTTSLSLGISISGFGGMAYTTLHTMQELLATDSVQYVMLELDDSSYSESVANAIRETYPNAQVITQQEVLEMTNQILNIILAVLLGMASISLLVGAIGIMNTTMTSVLERTREIGILKAIGSKRINILQVFLTEAFIIALIGGILGCISSVVLVIGLTTLVKSFMGFQMPYVFDTSIFIGGMVLAIVIGLISAAYPSWRASSVKPVEALRYE